MLKILLGGEKMDLKEFLWHAKSGHGECIFMLKKGNALDYKTIVKRIFLNNYAFLLDDEYRSAYACELVNFYHDDQYFLSLLWNKIRRTHMEDFYSFDYLINNLYFLLKRIDLLNYEKKIEKLLMKRLNKTIFTRNENLSICSLISLIIDLKMNIHIKEIVNQFYIKHENSNLDLSSIRYNYQIDIPSRSVTFDFDNEVFEDFNHLLATLSSNSAYKRIAFISSYISDEYVMRLLQLLESDSIHDSVKTNILRVIFYSEKRSFTIEKKIVDFYDSANEEQQNVIYEILCKTKSSKICSMIKAKKMEDSFFIRLLLNNYKEDKYEEIHQKIIKLKIDYSDSQHWFEVENELIEYFKRKTIDKRLLTDLKYFLKNGLSSTSRYEITKILEKYGMLSNEDVQYLAYDANDKIRKMFLGLKSKIE